MGLENKIENYGDKKQPCTDCYLIEFKKLLDDDLLVKALISINHDLSQVKAGGKVRE